MNVNTHNDGWRLVFSDPLKKSLIQKSVFYTVQSLFPSLVTPTCKNHRSYVRTHSTHDPHVISFLSMAPAWVCPVVARERPVATVYEKRLQRHLYIYNHEGSSGKNGRKGAAPMI